MSDPVATEGAATPDPLDAARAIAGAVDAAGGRALIVGGWVRDRLLGRVAKDLDLEVYGLAPAAPQEPARRLRIGQHRRRELHGLQGGRPGRLAAPPRVEDRPRPQGVRGHRRSGARSEGGGAAPRLHDQRDLLGSAARDLLRSVQRPLRPRRPRAARRRSADVRRRQPARAARDPVRRPLRGAARAGDVRDLPRHPAGRPAGRARLGRSREAAAPGGAAVARPAARARPRHRRAAVAGAARAGRLRAGSGVAPRRRRVGAHADGRRRRAHSASRDWIAAAR